MQYVLTRISTCTSTETLTYPSSALQSEQHLVTYTSICTSAYTLSAPRLVTCTSTCTSTCISAYTSSAPHLVTCTSTCTSAATSPQKLEACSAERRTRGRSRTRHPRFTCATSAAQKPTLPAAEGVPINPCRGCGTTRPERNTFGRSVAVVGGWVGDWIG